MSQLQVDVGKFYVTRNGKRAYVGFVDPFFDKLDPERKFIYGGRIEDDASAVYWNATGCAFDERGDGDLDLVAEWIDPEEYREAFISAVCLKLAAENRIAGCSLKVVAEAIRVVWIGEKIKPPASTGDS